MEPLDLTKHVPRSPREQLDGLVMLPRTIDKARATLPGGNLGPYHIAFGMSGILLNALGVSLDDFTQAVRSAKSDEDVAAWLRTKSEPDRYADISRKLLTETQDSIPPGHREKFNSLYEPALRAQHHVLFDLVDADDREIARERAGITG